MLVITTWCALLLVLCYKACQWISFYRCLKKIPGPAASLCLGNLSLFYERGKPLTYTIGPRLMALSETYQKEGLFLFYIGWKPIVCVFNPSAFQTILSSTTLIDKSTEYTMVGYWLGNGLATAQSDRWRKHRKILMPAFHTPVIKNYIPIFNEHAVLMCKKISKEKMFDDFHEYIVNVTLDIICETVMGVTNSARQGTTAHPYAKALQRFTEILVHKMFSPWLWPEPVFYLTSLGKEMRECSKVMHDFVRDVVQERKAALLQSMDEGIDEPPSPTTVRKTRMAFLDLLLKFHMDGQLSEQQVMEEVNTFTFAGHDTVGISIAFTLFCLGHHPEIQEKVAYEIEQVLGSDNMYEFTDEQLKKLKYLESVIKESLRLYPPGPSFGRKVNEDILLNGYKVPAGTDIWLNVKAIHMDPVIFPDPAKFDPDRFMNEANVPAFAFAAFSLGPRNCIGNRFAMTEEKILLSHILRKFTVVSHVPGEDLVLNFEIILRCRTPLKMEFIEKTSSPIPTPKILSPLARLLLSKGS